MCAWGSPPRFVSRSAEAYSGPAFARRASSIRCREGEEVAAFRHWTTTWMRFPVRRPTAPLRCRPLRRPPRALLRRRLLRRQLSRRLSSRRRHSPPLPPRPRRLPRHRPCSRRRHRYSRRQRPPFHPRPRSSRHRPPPHPRSSTRPRRFSHRRFSRPRFPRRRGGLRYSLRPRELRLLSRPRRPDRHPLRLLIPGRPLRRPIRQLRDPFALGAAVVCWPSS
ncbi:hypothetical protein BH11ACT3_BH11ACT3_21760 [soil metagenome]